MLRQSSIITSNLIKASSKTFFHPSSSVLPSIAKRNLAVIPFKLADIGEGIAEVELMKWFVKVNLFLHIFFYFLCNLSFVLFIQEGDNVKSFDRICEVQSDKATVEITSRYDGVITKIFHDEGAIVKVGSALLDIDTPSVESSEPVVEKEAPTKDTPATSSTSSAAPTHGDISKVLTTPAVRKIAKDNKIDLTLVKATGPKGRIIKEDVLNYIKNGNSNPSCPAAKTTSSTTSSAPSNVDEVTVIPIRGVQRLMVKSMNAANAVKHLTLGDEVIFNNLIKLRNNLKSTLAKKNIKISYLPFIIKASSLALNEYPSINSTVNAECTEIYQHSSHNIGVAMDTPKGLIVPVIKNVQNKSIIEIAKELNELQVHASNGTLTEAHLSGGTFTLSNIGSIGGTYAVPVLVVPQVAIGALGKLQVVPRYMNKFGKPATVDEVMEHKAEVHPITIMNISWSADHRVVDGATVAKFSNVWKNYLEHPELMLAEMH